MSAKKQPQNPASNGTDPHIMTCNKSPLWQAKGSVLHYHIPANKSPQNGSDDSDSGRTPCSAPVDPAALRAKPDRHRAFRPLRRLCPGILAASCPCLVPSGVEPRLYGLEPAASEVDGSGFGGLGRGALQALFPKAKRTLPSLIPVNYKLHVLHSCPSCCFPCMQNIS